LQAILSFVSRLASKHKVLALLENVFSPFVAKKKFPLFVFKPVQAASSESDLDSEGGPGAPPNSLEAIGGSQTRSSQPWA
jgi:hypothetical protein